MLSRMVTLAVYSREHKLIYILINSGLIRATYMTVICIKIFYIKEFKLFCICCH